MADIDDTIDAIDPNGDMPTISMSGIDERTLAVVAALRERGYTVENKPLDELDPAGRASVLAAREARRRGDWLREHGQYTQDEIDQMIDLDIPDSEWWKGKEQ
jgi:hypothetical protein